MTEPLALARRLFNGDDECTLGSGNVGGHLHIVLDDPNLEDGDVPGCLDQARADGCGTCATLAAGLLGLTEDEREQLYMHVHHLTESPFANEDEPLPVEQMVRNLLSLAIHEGLVAPNPAEGEPDPQLMTSGDLIAVANLLASYLRLTRS